MFLGPLRSEIQAVLGGLEETVVKRDMAYFHWPVTVSRVDTASANVDPFLVPYSENHAIHPFAMATADLSVALPRLDDIEQALSLPGRAGVLALLALKSGARTPQSQLSYEGPRMSMPEKNPGSAPLGKDVDDMTSRRNLRRYLYAHLDRLRSRGYFGALVKPRSNVPTLTGAAFLQGVGRFHWRDAGAINSARRVRPAS